MEQLVEGRTGTLPDGTRVIVRGGKIVPIGQPGGGARATGGRGRQSPQEAFDVTAARERAKADAKRLSEASAAQLEAYGNEATALQADAILPGTPVGAFVGQRTWAGTNLPALSGLPFVPNKEETANLKSLTRLGSMGALGDVGKLKGPLSEKELAFIRELQFDPSASREYNQDVSAVMKWVARRQAAYGSSLKRWSQTLGSPSATNANGLDFDSWWGRYSGENLPPPGVPRRARPQAAVTQGDGWKVLSVE